MTSEPRAPAKTKHFFVIVSQSNWNKKCMNAAGREYTSISHYVPSSVDEARYLDSIGMVKLVEVEGDVDAEDLRPGCPWGHGVYYFEKDWDKPLLVKADWDSSG